MYPTTTIRRIFAAILALAMACGLCACGGDTPVTPSGDYTQVAEEFLEAYYLRDYVKQYSLMFFDARQRREDALIQQEGSAEAFFTYAQKQAKDEHNLDVNIQSFDDYFNAYHQFYLASAKDVYGDYTMNVDTTAVKKLEGAILTEFINKQLGAIDEKYVDEAAYRAITDAYLLTVNLTIDGEKKDYNENYLVYMVYHDGQWWVAEHSA